MIAYVQRFLPEGNRVDMPAKPAVVRIATWLLWISVALDVVFTMVDYLGGAEHDVGTILALLTALVFTALGATFTFFYSRGRRWARVAIAVFFGWSVFGLTSLASPDVTIKDIVTWRTVYDMLALGFATWAGFSNRGASWFSSAETDGVAMRMMLPVGRSGWAIAAGYLALFSVLIVPAPFALACGVMAVRDIRRHPERHGMGRAVFGIIMGTLGILAVVVVLWMRAHR